MIDEEEWEKEALALMFVLRIRASERAAADSSERAIGCEPRRCQPSKTPPPSERDC